MVDNTVILNTVTVMFLLIMLGYVIMRFGGVQENFVQFVSFLLINVAAPAIIIVFFQISYSSDMLHKIWLMTGYSFLIHFTLMALSGIVYYRMPQARRSVMSFAAVFPNIVFMGFPIFEALFGPIGIFYVSIFLLPHNLILWTYGQSIFLPKMGFKTLKQVLNPPFVAVIIGLIFFVLQFELPVPVYNSMDMLGRMTTPLAMILAGCKMAQSSLKEVLTDLGALLGSLIRLILTPLITYGLLMLIGADPLLAKICIMVETMPVAALGVVQAEKLGGDSVLMSRCMAMSTILSLVTIPIAALLLLG